MVSALFRAMSVTLGRSLVACLLGTDGLPLESEICWVAGRGNFYSEFKAYLRNQMEYWASLA